MVPEADPKTELWDGKMPGTAGARRDYGAERAAPFGVDGAGVEQALLYRRGRYICHCAWLTPMYSENPYGWQPVPG